MKASLAAADYMRMSGVRSQRGYALLIMLVIAVLGSLFAVTGQLEFVSRKYARDENTSKALALAKEALIGYAVTYRDDPSHSTEVFGYLPCPDTAEKTGIQTPGDGEAANSCGTAGQAAVGLLPYKTLGLPDLRDSDGVCLWYAVSGAFKNNPKGTDATAATPTQLNWDTQGQFSIQDANGNTLVQPNDSFGGAAAVIFAAGLPLASQNRSVSSSNPCQIVPSEISAYLDGNYSFASNATILITQGSSSSSSNNDQLAWVTPKDMFAKVVARSDFNWAFVNPGINDIQATLTNHLGSYSPAAGNMLPATNPFTSGTSDHNFYDNWSENFRFLACSPANTYCYSINGTDCDGALLFGGLPTQALNNTTSPRPSTKRANLNYFETGSSGGLDLLNGTSSQVVNAVQSYTSSTSNADIVQCLTPIQAQISASQMFATTNPAISGKGLITTTGSTLTLGTTTPGTNGALLYGCSWNPTMAAFGNGLRVYFEYTVNQRSEGFTFALADADSTRNPTTSMCGAAEDALGYAGSNGVTASVNYPKIALEFDLQRSNPGPLGINRNDPTTTPAMHFAFDYWGTGTDVNDDVTHGAGGSGGDPTNPAVGSTGLKQPSASISNGTTVYVRMDIARAYNSAAGTGTYTLNAYIARAYLGSFPTSKLLCNQSDFTDLTGDLASACAYLQSNTYSSYLRYLTDTIIINDIVGEAMRHIYLGYTTGQKAAVNQSITIANFMAATH